MKKLFVILGLLIPAIFYGQRVYTDSIDVSLLVANDTTVFPELNRINAGGIYSIEIVFTTFNDDDAYFAVGYSNIGNTFNFASKLFGASTDSVVLSTATGRIVNGAHSSVEAIATKQSTKLFTGEIVGCKFPGLYLNKGSVTSGKLYYYILKL